MHENLRMWEFQKKFACPPLVLITEITTLKPAVLRFKIRMVFGPSGSWSGSVSQRYGSRFRSGSEPFYHHAKIVKKTSIPTVLWLLYNFLFLKNDVNVTSISNKQKNIEFFYVLNVTDENSRIRFRHSVLYIHGSVSVPKSSCHGSATLEARSTF